MLDDLNQLMKPPGNVEPVTVHQGVAYVAGHPPITSGGSRKNVDWMRSPSRSLRWGRLLSSPENIRDSAPPSRLHR